MRETPKRIITIAAHIIANDGEFESSIASTCDYAGIEIPANCDGTEAIRFYRDDSGIWHAGASRFDENTDAWGDEWAEDMTDAIATDIVARSLMASN